MKAYHPSLYKKNLLLILSKTKISFKLIYIDDTNGQAVTAYLACKYILSQHPIANTGKRLGFAAGVITV